MSLARGDAASFLATNFPRGAARGDAASFPATKFPRGAAANRVAN